MIKISAELNRVLFDAIHDLVGMACDRGVPLPHFGICRNVYHILDRTEEAHFIAYTVLANVFEDMGLHRVSPVLSTTGPFCEFWNGSQFRLRMDLCSKLMSYLDIQLAQENLREHDTLLDALKALANIPNKFMPWPHQGICSNASTMLRNFPTYGTLAQIFEGMGYADRDYPLGQNGWYINKWENPRRRELLAQVIQHLEGFGK